MIRNIEPIQVSFAISKCKCISFNFSKHGIDNSNELSKKILQFVLTISTQFDIPTKKIGVVIKSSLLNPQDKSLIADIETLIEFAFLDIEPILIKSGDQTLIPDQILSQMFAVSISTLRGMYAIKFEGSAYEEAILPMIDASQFIPKKSSNIG